MKARGHTAVMAQHAPNEVKGDTPLRRLQRKLQYFPTPPWAARAGAELVTRLDPGRWACWEPACGEGHMVHGLKDYFPAVIRTDIHDHGWDGLDRIQDFLAVERGVQTEADWVFTNPPFGQAADFVRLGLQRARRGVAILIRTGWKDTGGRWDLFSGAMRCDVQATFFDRVAMELGGWNPKGSTATSYTWFIWFTDEARPAWLNEIRRSMGEHAPPGYAASAISYDIAPGTKERLTKADDARLFGRCGEAPLLEGLV